MGSVFTSIANKLGAYNDFRIVMVGLENSGKTTVLNSFMKGEKVTTVPSPGTGMDVVNFENVTFCVIDMGEKHPEKSAWADQLTHARALIFVVDAHDRDRILEARQLLYRLCERDELKNKPFLIYGSKSDLPNALSEADLKERLGLTQCTSGRQWHLQMISCAQGSGISEGLEWIVDTIGVPENMKEKFPTHVDQPMKVDKESTEYKHTGEGQFAGKQQYGTQEKFGDKEKFGTKEPIGKEIYKKEGFSAHGEKIGEQPIGEKLGKEQIKKEEYSAGGQKIGEKKLGEQHTDKPVVGGQGYNY